VGSTKSLGAITIVSAADVTTSSTLNIASLTQTAGSGTTTFGGAVTSSAVAGLDLTGTAFTFNEAVTTASSGTIKINNSGLLTFKTGISLNPDGAFTQTGAGAFTIGGNITTTNDDISFAKAVTLTANSEFSTGSGAGTITFGNTLDGTSGSETLKLTAGTGNILFTGAVGSTKSLGAITIVSAADVTTSSTLNIASLTQTAGSGTTTFGGAVTSSAATGLDLTGTAFTINGSITTASSGTLKVNNSGLLTINSGINLNLDGSFTQTGAGAVAIGGNITTSNDDISFAKAVTLTANTELSTGSGTGTITFNTTLDGTSGSETLKLTAGTGNILFTGAVGSTKAPGAITIVSAANVTTNSTLNIASLTQTAGSGTTTFDGAVTSSSATGLDLTGTAFTFNEAITTASSGTLKVNNSGLLTFKTGINPGLDGSFTQTGSGAVTLGGNITTTNDDISFAKAVTLTANSEFSTGSGAGTITFGNTLDGTSGSETLKLTAGTGNILFTGAVGSTKSLGAITIVSATDVTTSSTLNIASLTQTAGSGTTTFGGTVTSSAATGLDLTGTAFTFNEAVTTASSGTLKVNNSGLLTIKSGIKLNLDGSFTQTGSGAVTLGGNITTTNDDISFAKAVTLSANTELSSGSASILFHSSIDSEAGTHHSLLIDASGNNTTFKGDLGSLTRIGGIKSLSDSGTMTFHGDIFTEGSDVQFSGTGKTISVETVDGRTFQIDTGRDGATSTSGSITFGSSTTLKSSNAHLKFDASGSQGGSVTLPNDLTAASVTAKGNTMRLGNITATGTQSSDGSVTVEATDTTIFGTKILAHGNVDFSKNSKIILENNLAISTDSSPTNGRGGNITFSKSGSIDGALVATASSDRSLLRSVSQDVSLTIDAASQSATPGAIDLPSIGQTTPLASLQVDGGLITVHGGIATSGGDVRFHQNSSAGDLRVVTLGDRYFCNATLCAELDTTPVFRIATNGGDITFNKISAANGTGGIDDFLNVELLAGIPDSPLNAADTKNDLQDKFTKSNGGRINGELDVWNATLTGSGGALTGEIHSTRSLYRYLDTEHQAAAETIFTFPTPQSYFTFNGLTVPGLGAPKTKPGPYDNLNRGSLDLLPKRTSGKEWILDTSKNPVLYRAMENMIEKINNGNGAIPESTLRKIPAKSKSTTNTKTDFHMVIIGVEKHEKLQKGQMRFWKDMPGTENGVATLSKLFENFGYHVVTLMDPQSTEKDPQNTKKDPQIKQSKDDILDTIRKFPISGNQKQYLIIYFAGHGLIHEGDSYLLASDSVIGTDHVMQGAISMKDIKDAAKHILNSNTEILVIPESCQPSIMSAQKTEIQSMTPVRPFSNLPVSNDKNNELPTFFSQSLRDALVILSLAPEEYSTAMSVFKIIQDRYRGWVLSNSSDGIYDPKVSYSDATKDKKEQIPYIFRTRKK
ncbi:MAG: hypothetical protein HQL76_16855, partial [Magnetococcales bacterium]|nr:hypothetical protein [Magnetococcales bacterium]